MNLMASLLVWTIMLWVMIPYGEGMYPSGQTEIDSAPSTPRGTPPRSGSGRSSPAALKKEEKLNWFQRRKQKKKQEEEEKEKAAAKKRKPANTGKEVMYYGDVSTVDATCYSQMIRSIIKNDPCTDGKANANAYCKMVTGYLNKLRPDNRSPDCPHVTNGRCAEINGQKVCPVDTYTKMPCCGCFTNRKTEKTLLKFRECVGSLDY